MRLALDSSHERFEHSTSIMRRGTTSGKRQQLNSHGEERWAESASSLTPMARNDGRKAPAA